MSELSWNDVVDTPEDNMEMVESFDYVPAPRIIPGGTLLYSERRTTIPKTSKAGNTFFEVSFTGGLEDLNTGARYGAGQYPEKSFLFGHKREETKESGGKGFTTDIASYIKKCGLTPKDFSSVKAALQAADTCPVMIVADLEDDLKQEDGTYRQREKGEKSMRTQDFANPAAKDDPSAPAYLNIVEKDGKTFKARNVFKKFVRVPKSSTDSGPVTE